MARSRSRISRLVRHDGSYGVAAIGQGGSLCARNWDGPGIVVVRHRVRINNRVRAVDDVDGDDLAILGATGCAADSEPLRGFRGIDDVIAGNCADGDGRRGHIHREGEGEPGALTLPAASVAVAV